MDERRHTVTRLSPITLSLRHHQWFCFRLSHLFGLYLQTQTFFNLTAFLTLPRTILIIFIVMYGTVSVSQIKKMLPSKVRKTIRFKYYIFFRNDNQMHVKLTFADVFPGRLLHIRGDVHSFRLFSGYWVSVWFVFLKKSMSLSSLEATLNTAFSFLSSSFEGPLGRISPRIHQRGSSVVL